MSHSSSKCHKKSKSRCNRVRSCKYVDKTLKYCRSKKNRICKSKSVDECSMKKSCKYVNGNIRSYCRRRSTVKKHHA